MSAEAVAVLWAVGMLIAWPAEVLKEFAALLAERVGLSAGIDSAKVAASVEFAEATLRLLKVSER